MKEISYEDFIQEIKQENIINVYTAEKIVEHLLQGDVHDEDFNFESRKKMRELAKLFEDRSKKILATPGAIHNCSVSYVKEGLYDSACLILERGIEDLGTNVNLLADYIKNGIMSRNYDKCNKFYMILNKVSKKEWNSKTYSFSIDFLLDELQRTTNKNISTNLKRKIRKLSDEFVTEIGDDQAYFDKAHVLEKLGYKEKDQELVLQTALKSLKVCPKCALLMSDKLFKRGEYKEATHLLRKCCIDAFVPQSNVNSGYSFLLSALSKISSLFSEHEEKSFENERDNILDIYRDFNSALANAKDDDYIETAKTAIKIIEAQTDIEYPYSAFNNQYEY